MATNKQKPQICTELILASPCYKLCIIAQYAITICAIYDSKSPALKKFQHFVLAPGMNVLCFCNKAVITATGLKRFDVMISLPRNQLMQKLDKDIKWFPQDGNTNIYNETYFRIEKPYNKKFPLISVGKFAPTTPEPLEWILQMKFAATAIPRPVFHAYMDKLEKNGENIDNFTCTTLQLLLLSHPYNKPICSTIFAKYGHEEPLTSRHVRPTWLSDDYISYIHKHNISPLTLTLLFSIPPAKVLKPSKNEEKFWENLPLFKEEEKRIRIRTIMS